MASAVSFIERTCPFQHASTQPAHRDHRCRSTHNRSRSKLDRIASGEFNERRKARVPRRTWRPRARTLRNPAPPLRHRWKRSVRPPADRHRAGPGLRRLPFLVTRLSKPSFSSHFAAAIAATTTVANATVAAATAAPGAGAWVAGGWGPAPGHAVNTGPVRPRDSRERTPEGGPFTTCKQFNHECFQSKNTEDLRTFDKSNNFDNEYHNHKTSESGSSAARSERPLFVRILLASLLSLASPSSWGVPASQPGAPPATQRTLAPGPTGVVPFQPPSRPGEVAGRSRAPWNLCEAEPSESAGEGLRCTRKTGRRWRRRRLQRVLAETDVADDGDGGGGGGGGGRGSGASPDDGALEAGTAAQKRHHDNEGRSRPEVPRETARPTGTGYRRKCYGARSALRMVLPALLIVNMFTFLHGGPVPLMQTIEGEQLNGKTGSRQASESAEKNS
ncbi:uncharacterized protein LOC128720770 [Anopheles nili]|uniref:uncharacterized protein LOC128720770 n=1 Tax=Anopheles nili TaxID=185578 RepID=UPI00237BF1A1|nr:uncharacterized protein LOC128720770 [Anopheles nili]